MRILVCGGRDFGLDPREVCWAYECLKTFLGKATHVIHGASKGADTMAAYWAAGIAQIPMMNILPYPADWVRDGKAAGPIRNQIMLDAGRPDIVIAFPGGRGTTDMVKRAERQNISVQKFSMVDYEKWLKSSSQVTPITTTPTS